MEADVPLGAFLSGGVDSSTVVALMQAQSSRPVKTFTIGFEQDSYNEAGQANQIARYLGTEHSELYVTGGDAMAVIPRVGGIYDEPFADASQIPTILVSELARERVTVSLSGDGGDELFGGYTRHIWTDTISRRTRALPAWLRRGSAQTITSIGVERWDRLFHILNPLLPGAFRQRNPGEKLHKLAGALAGAGGEAMYRALLSQWSDPAEVVPGASGTEPGLPVFESLVDLMMFADTSIYLPEALLVKIDRASMSVSLESRAPLLDHRLIEWAWRIPRSLKIQNGRGKWLLRQVLNRYVPEALTDRPKMGFDVPVAEWLRGPLRGWAEELLSKRRLEADGFFHAGQIRGRWREHLAESRNWQDSLWSILVFQGWLDENRARPSGHITKLVTTKQ
jgi:asparagine synthase (glutamine-hydrolysing)